MCFSLFFSAISRLFYRLFDIFVNVSPTVLLKNVGKESKVKLGNKIGKRRQEFSNKTD